MTQKKERYLDLIPKIKAIVNQELGLTANLAGIAAVLKQEMNYFWVGFYLVKNNILEVGPYQGPVACVGIEWGKGVCGKCWQEKAPIIVNDINAFKGHIGCNPNSKSEIVIPVLDPKGEVRMVIDVDSDNYSDFNEVDEFYLLKVAGIIERLL
jgi:GAF domain-containing protein